MLAVGKRHAVSWLHIEKLNAFSEAYKLEHNEMARRIAKLEAKVKQQSAKIRGMETSTAQNHDGETTSSRAGTQSNMIHRRVTDDMTLNETGELISELQRKLKICKVSILRP